MNTRRSPLPTALLLLALAFIAGLAPRAVPAAESAAQQRFFASLKADGKKTVLMKTRTVGSPTGIEYADTAPEGKGLIVGFDFWTSNYGQTLVVNGVCPIYLTPKGKVRGKKRGYVIGNLVTVEARDGFAVSGVAVKGGDRMDQVQVEFMRIDYAKQSLEPATLYKSAWTGGKGGRRERQLTGNGKPVLGIHGASGDALDRFGLLYVETK